MDFLFMFIQVTHTGFFFFFFFIIILRIISQVCVCAGVMSSISNLNFNYVLKFFNSAIFRGLGTSKIWWNPAESVIINPPVICLHLEQN